MAAAYHQYLELAVPADHTHLFLAILSNFCKMTKHNLVQFNTEVYYQNVAIYINPNVYISFN